MPGTTFCGKAWPLHFKYASYTFVWQRYVPKTQIIYWAFQYIFFSHYSHAWHFSTCRMWSHSLTNDELDSPVRSEWVRQYSCILKIQTSFFPFFGAPQGSPSSMGGGYSNYVSCALDYNSLCLLWQGELWLVEGTPAHSTTRLIIVCEYIHTSIT